MADTANFCDPFAPFDVQPGVFSLIFEIFFGSKSAKNKLFQKIDRRMRDDFL